MQLPQAKKRVGPAADAELGSSKRSHCPIASYRDAFSELVSQDSNLRWNFNFIYWEQSTLGSGRSGQLNPRQFHFKGPKIWPLTNELDLLAFGLGFSSFVSPDFHSWTITAA